MTRVSAETREVKCESLLSSLTHSLSDALDLLDKELLQGLGCLGNTRALRIEVATVLEYLGHVSNEGRQGCVLALAHLALDHLQI